MNTIRFCMHSIRMLMKSRLQYPLSFTVQTLAQLVMEAGEMLAVLLVIDRFGSLKEWSGGELLIFFGVMSITFYLTEIFGRGITGGIDSMIRQGGMDILLIRPRSVITQMVCRDVDPRRIGCIAVGMTALITGTAQIGLVWTAGRILLLLEAIFFGMMLVLGLFLIEATCSIFSVRSLEMVNTLTYGGRSACQYPIDVFPKPIRLIFSVIAPFSLTLHVPVSFIVGKPLFGWPQWTAFVCPLSGAVILAVMTVVFNIGIRHYRSTGS